MDHKPMDSSHLITGDFPRISRLRWFPKGSKYKPGTVVCPKFGDDDVYVMLESSIIDRVAGLIYDNPITKNIPIIDKIAEGIERGADRLIVRFRDPIGILAEEVCADEERVQAAVWVTGCFNPEAVCYGEGLDHEVVEKMLSDKCIYLVKRAW